MSKEELLDLVAQLKAWRHIIGQPFTLDKMLDPIEEQEIGECLDSFEGQDLGLEIVGMVQAKVRGDIIEEVSSDSDSDEPEVVPPGAPFSQGDDRSFKNFIHLCGHLTRGSWPLHLPHTQVPKLRQAIFTQPLTTTCVSRWVLVFKHRQDRKYKILYIQNT